MRSTPIRTGPRSVARAAFCLGFFALAPLAMGAKLVDDFEDDNQTNALGGAWHSIADATSILRPATGFTPITGHASVGAASFGYKRSIAAVIPTRPQRVGSIRRERLRGPEVLGQRTRDIPASNTHRGDQRRAQSLCD